MRYAVIGAIFIGMVVGFGTTANAQPRQRFGIPGSSKITAEIDRSVQLAMEDASRLLQQKQFDAAVTLLQSILDNPEDFFMVEEFNPKNIPQRRVKSETLRILAELPGPGRKAYELHFGITARDHLNRAFATNDLEELSIVASNYQMTAAGFEALQALVALAFDRDQPLEAAILCDTILGHPKAVGELRELLLLQGAYAWHLAGDSKRSLAALRELKPDSNSVSWQIGGRRISPFKSISDAPEWLKTQFGPPVHHPVAVSTTWSSPRGGLTGNESATDSYPIGGGSWSVPTLKHIRFPLNDDVNRKWLDEFDQMTQEIERTMRDVNRLTQPVSVPLIVGDVVAYRTLNDVTAVSLKTGQLLWRSSASDGMLARLLQSQLAATENSPSSSPMSFRDYLRFKLFRDQSSGSLTSDGKNVYAIEESDSQYAVFQPRNRQIPTFSDPTNKLVAYDLAGGRILWEIGGPNGTPPMDLSGIFFLGPPISYAGRLYCLVESKNEIRLLSLIPEANTARLEWSQALIATTTFFGLHKIQFATLRRLAGTIPAISDRIAVCSTANGSVVAFDLVQRQLRWGYSYESLSNRNTNEGGDSMFEEEEEGRWLDGGPVLANGRVIVTPRDSTEIHCLSLIDGALLWSRPRDGGLYVACVDDEKVIVIERSQIAAYSMADGSPMWAEPTQISEPSGRGIRIGSQYLLPLSTGEIATMQLSSGRIVARSRLPDNRIPGNLAIGSGALVSHGTNAIDGFQSLVEIEGDIAKLFTSNINDPQALALQGELRLHRGEEDKAIDDLRRSLKEKPQPRVRRILAETLLNRMRSDPRSLLESSDELEAMADDPRQRIEFLRLSARSLNETGEPVRAVKQLFRLSATSEIPDEMTSISPDHFISLDQSIRSQLFEISLEANSRQRAEIAEVFAKEFEASLVSSDRNRQMTQFIKLTIGHPAADSLLLRLADSKDEFPDDATRTRLLERLSNSENKTIAGSAVAALAYRLLVEDAPREAQPSIERLGRDFSTVVCRDEKTGQQLRDEWIERADIRNLTAKEFTWPEGPIETQRMEEGMMRFTFPVDIATHVGPYFVDWSFEADVKNSDLVARDQTLQEVWRLPLPGFSEDLRMQPIQLHIRGRRLALSSGMKFVVLDATTTSEAPRILFEQSLRRNSLVPFRPFSAPFESRLLPNGHRFQLATDIQGTAGFLVGMSDDAVCYQLDNRLYAADPETGRTLWSRVGSRFARSDGTIDKMVTLNTPDNGGLLLRTLDGEIEQRHIGNRDDLLIWFQGTRRLSHRTLPPDQRIFEMHDFDGDRVVWQTQHPFGSLHTVVDDTDFVILEPSGKVVILNLKTGEVRLTSELPVKRPLGTNGVIAVQKCKDRYVIIAGSPEKNLNHRRILSLDSSAHRDFGISSIKTLTLDGHVTAIDHNDGHILWTVAITDTVFDPAQSPNLPVIVFASRYNEVDQTREQVPRVSILMIDKRTGEKVFETEESMSPVGRGMQFLANIEDRKLIVDFTAWRLELKFPQPK